MLDSFPNLHPFVVHFPIALFAFAVVCDVFLLVLSRAPWLDRGLTALYASAAFAALGAAVSGKLAEPAPERVSAEAFAVVGSHGDWAFLTVVLCFVVAFLRFDTFWRDRTEPSIRLDRRRGAVLALALVTAGALLRTAAYGGALVFHHGVGVSSPLASPPQEGGR